MFVEGVPTLELRNRHHEVAPCVAHQAFHLPLVVALARATETIGEQVVRLEFAEHSRALAFAVAKDFRHRDLGVVVDDVARHAAEVLKRGVVSLAECFRRLGGKSLYEGVVAVRQVDHQEVCLALDSADDYDGFAEVGLRVAGRMRQWHEHLLSAKLLLAHVVLDDRVAAREGVLVAQTIGDAFRGVALFPMLLLIVQQDLINDPGKRFQLRTPHRLASPIARRSSVAQHFAHRLPRQAEPPGGLAFTQPFDKDTAPYLSV